MSYQKEKIRIFENLKERSNFPKLGWVGPGEAIPGRVWERVVWSSLAPANHDQASMTCVRFNGWSSGHLFSTRPNSGAFFFFSFI